jgi:hypothetical protein
MKLKGGTMKTRIRPVVAALIAALAAVVFATVAGASSSDRVLPARLIAPPELSAVTWDATSNAFIQFQFDRGKVMSTATASSGNTITIRQGSAGHVWRTQTFTIPASATIRLNLATLPSASANAPDSWKKVPFTRLKDGMNVRIVQTGPVGGTLQIVRVDAQRADRDIPIPTAAG